MKPITLHPLSVVAGAGLLAIVLIASGALQVQALVGSPARPLVIAGIPTPAQMVRVSEDQPLIVPQGTVFVATGIASTANNTDGGHKVIEVQFDGTTVLLGTLSRPAGVNISGSGPSIPQIPPGLVAPAGTTVGVKESSSTASNPAKAVLLGYLANAEL
jgi:hypothetical protein